ncbi:MAG: hypothetical protein ABSD73_02770 [Candidatus Bathyarchaeia archaeon]|jgi:phosphopantetheine adenylyltransferase
MPISDTRKWKVNKPAEEVRKTVVNTLASKKATLLEASTTRIEAKIGSEAKTRFLGGIFVSKETLPVKMTMQINETGGESEINATIMDNLGVGLRTGMEGKYKEYIQSLFNELANALQVKS